MCCCCVCGCGGRSGSVLTVLREGEELVSLVLLFVRLFGGLGGTTFSGSSGRCCMAACTST